MVTKLNSPEINTTSKQNLSPTQDCGCKIDNTVFTLCNGADEECKTGNCTETSSYCGFLLLERCDGQCSIPQPGGE